MTTEKDPDLLQLEERLAAAPGFVYKLETEYWYLGRFICAPCREQDATDSWEMFVLFADASGQEGWLYFHRLRGYSDMALTPPYDPEQVRACRRDAHRAVLRAGPAGGGVSAAAGRTFPGREKKSFAAVGEAVSMSAPVQLMF